MKTSRISLLAAAIFAFGCTLATAAEVPAQATVLKVTGSVQVQLPGQSAMVDLQVGDKIPQGAVITTGAGAEAYIQPFSGTVSTIKENSTVEIEKLSQTTEGGVVKQANTLLNLRSGNLVSNLDPSKRAFNNYGVRTPKGVAAARGTSYSVSVSAGGFSVAATADNVTFTTSTGATYSISAGMIAITLPGQPPSPPVPLAQAVASHPEVAQVVQTAVQTVSTIVQNNLGGISSESPPTW